MIRVTVKAKAMDDKRLKVWDRFSEMDGPDPMDEALKVVEMFRKHVSDVDKVRIDIEFHADCGCIQDNRPKEETN